jgi:hypothetical protein
MRESTMRSWRHFLCSSLALLLLAAPAGAGPLVPGTTVGGVYQSPPPTLSSGQTSTFNLDSAGNLLVDVAAGGGSGGTSSTFGAAFPGTGTAAGFYLSGNMTYAGVDAAHNLDVNCVVGCAGGTASNGADAVATSATNGQTLAWLYGFNGTTFDRLRDDANKYLFVDLGTALPAGSNVIGAVTQSGSWSVAATQSGTWTVQPGNTANTTAWLVTGAGGTFPATQSGTWNIGSITTLPALPAGSNTIGAVNQAGAWTVTANAGTGTFAVAQPMGCAGQAVSSTNVTPFSLTASAQVIAGSSGKQTYICAINITAPDNAVALVEGTGTNCGTGTAGMAGGTTAATGWVFNNATAPGVGLVEGTGRGVVARTATAADNVCLIVGAATQVSGTIVWSQF